MRPMLLACPSCQRHVKSGTSLCPFCQSDLSASHGTLRPSTAPDTRGWKRAAVFTFGAALTVAGCSSTSTGSDASPQDVSGDTTPTDTAPTDSARTDSAPTDAQPDVAVDVPGDEGGVAPPYGIPADAGPPDDDGSFKADYGGPPRDASLD